MSAQTPDVPGPAFDLIGQIVSANVTNLARTTDRIEASLRAEILRLAGYIEQVDVILSKATVVDRETEYRLSNIDYVFAEARDVLRRAQESR